MCRSTFLVNTCYVIPQLTVLLILLFIEKISQGCPGNRGLVTSRKKVMFGLLIFWYTASIVYIKGQAISNCRTSEEIPEESRKVL